MRIKIKIGLNSNALKGNFVVFIEAQLEVGRQYFKCIQNKKEKEAINLFTKKKKITLENKEISSPCKGSAQSIKLLIFFVFFSSKSVLWSCKSGYFGQ